MELMRAFVQRWAEPKTGGSPLKVLDIGSLDVNGTYKDLFPAPKYEYKGLDIIPGGNVDIVARGPYDYFPVENDSIDLVVSGQTMEHVEAIWLWVLEMKRILKVGGLMCLIVVNEHCLHRHPVDCWRVRADGMIYLLRTHAGLEILEAKEVGIDTIGIARK